MAHTAPPTHARRRGERFFGIVLAVIGCLVAVVAVVALNHPNGRRASAANETALVSTSSSPTSSAAAGQSTASANDPTAAGQSAAAVTTPPPSPVRPALVVLNNTERTGLAAGAADTFRHGGWTVTSVADYANDILSTAAYYDPSVPGAQAAADQLQKQFPAIKRVEPRFGDLPAGPIVVVLTDDYS